MISSCCTLRLNRRSALSIDSPSCTFTSAKLETPPSKLRTQNSEHRTKNAQRGLRVLGPSRAAAQLESSKIFAKNFMARHGIPTARYRVCTNPDEARNVIT